MGIQIEAIALTSWDHLEKDWNFSKILSTHLYLKGLQNGSLSKLAHTSHHPGIEPGPTKTIWPALKILDLDRLILTGNFGMSYLHLQQ